MKKNLELWRTLSSFTFAEAALLITCNNPDDWNGKEDDLLTSPPMNFNILFKQFLTDATTIVNPHEVSQETGEEFTSYFLNLEIQNEKPSLIKALSKKELLSVIIDKEELLRWLRLPHQPTTFQNTAWFFDNESETYFEESFTPIPILSKTDQCYPKELDIAIRAWLAVSTNKEKGKPKTNIRKWLDINFKDSELSNSAKERITVLVNWDKKGGPAKTD
jgi:hypothetical protein